MGYCHIYKKAVALNEAQYIYVAGAFRNVELFRIQNSSQEVIENCC